MEQVMVWLDENKPTYNESVITHGDYKLDNMVFHPTEVWKARTRGNTRAQMTLLY